MLKWRILTVIVLIKINKWGIYSPRRKMMEKQIIQISWKGPFTLDEIECSDFNNGLYLLAGKRLYEREKTIQYCGITEGFYKNRFKKHHKLIEITRELEIWIGSISFPTNSTRTHLEIAEKIIIYFWQPELNERKRFSLPRPTTVISNWYKKNGDPRFNQKNIYSNLSDVLSWDGDYWRIGNLKLYED